MKKKLCYEDIDPYCKWQKGCKEDAFDVYVPGFTKQQLKATINSFGVLKITGERSPDEHRRIRFCKEINVSKDYKRDEIQTKFLNGIISVTMPKRIPSESTQADQLIQESGDKQINLLSATLRTMKEKIECVADAVPTLEMSGKTALKLGALVAVLAAGAYIAY